MKCAANEVVTLVTNNAGRTREIVRVCGEIRRPAYFETMAAYHPQTTQQWHLEQYFPMWNGWFSAEIQYRLSCHKNLAVAMTMARKNKKMFRVVFRDEYTEDETVLSAMADIKQQAHKFPKGGPFLDVNEAAKFLPEQGEVQEGAKVMFKRKRELQPAMVAPDARNTGQAVVLEGKPVYAKPMAYVDGQFLGKSEE